MLIMKTHVFREYWQKITKTHRTLSLKGNKNHTENEPVNRIAKFCFCSCFPKN